MCRFAKEVDTSFWTQSSIARLSVDRFGIKKIHVEHLYQSFSYLSNSNSQKRKVRGDLALSNGRDISQRAVFHSWLSDYVRTLNLAQPWQGIHSDLLSLIPT